MRASSVAVAAALGLFNAVHADLHQIFVGTYSSNFIYTIEFDDVAKSLTLLKNSSAEAGSSWLALSHDKKNLYGNSYNNGPYFYSYSINNATSLTHDKTLGMNCSAKMSIFQVAQTVKPYAVYGNSWAGSDASCGVVMSVDEKGALSEVIQNYTYVNGSGVHGMAFDPKESFIYSADYSNNSVWTHKIDSTTGKLTAVQQLQDTVLKAEPRHISVHPSGYYAYVVTEAGNTFDVYKIDQITHELSFEKNYSLFASGAIKSNYKSSDVMLSASGSYAWATTRGANDTVLGHLSGYKLGANGSVESQIFVQETSTAMGFSGSITPSPVDDRWFALTDTIERKVEMYEWNGTVAKVVASVDLKDGGCCSNVVWYS